MCACVCGHAAYMEPLVASGDGWKEENGNGAPQQSGRHGGGHGDGCGVGHGDGDGGNGSHSGESKTRSHEQYFLLLPALWK